MRTFTQFLRESTPINRYKDTVREPMTVEDLSDLEQTIRNYAKMLHDMGADRAASAKKRPGIWRDHHLDQLAPELRRLKTRYDEYCQEHARLVGPFKSKLFLRAVERELLDEASFSMDDFDWAETPETAAPATPPSKGPHLDQILARGYHSQLKVGPLALTLIGGGNNTFTKTGTAGRRLYALRTHGDGTGSVYPYPNAGSAEVDWEHPVVDRAPITLL